MYPSHEKRRITASDRVFLIKFARLFRVGMVFAISCWISVSYTHVFELIESYFWNEV